MENIDKEWNYALSYEGPIAVIAPPGGRKTTLATQKSLLSKEKSVLCLAFTREDARVLGEYLYKQVSYEEDLTVLPPERTISTIHSFCYSHVGWKLTYDDLLWRFTKMARKPQYDLVIVDEFQDLSPLELEVILSISDNIFAVGDPYQSIYGFQGALGSRAFEILHEEKKAEVFEMHGNYRSSPSIVSKIESIYPRSIQSLSTIHDGCTRVLFRYNDSLLITSRELEKRKIPHKLIIAENVDNHRITAKLGGGKLSLSTIHTAKGTQADRVITYGWEPPDLYYEGEEKRIHYVASSRAGREYHEADNIEDLISILTTQTK